VLLGREVGNVFAMLFAGHGLCICPDELSELLKSHLTVETTASVLAATIGFLGVYSEVQDDIYQKVIEVVGHDRDPVCRTPSRLLHLVTSIAIDL
jgi:hypothetical protein